ncbi:MAG: glutathione S-transferase family protein [Hyphomicrobiaceae bacterium]
MITLYSFGPAFGLPDPSSFVAKAEVLLKMSGLDYVTDTTGFNNAPKGKLPYINDDGTVIADTTFIRLHLEKKYGVDFDPGLSDKQKANAWALEKMCEDHLYWLIVHDRWMNDDVFDRGPRKFFDFVPALLRPLVIWKVRKSVKRDLWGQGVGRHTDAERIVLADKTLTALADALGDKDFIMGSKPCGADASIWACVAGILCPHFDVPTLEIGAKHDNLVAYRDRGMKLWFPEIETTRA